MEINEKKNEKKMNIYFFGVFSSSRYEKKMDECIFGIFQCSGTNEKKNLMKKKKKIFFGAKSFLGYCPNDIVRKYFVLQESGLYCRDLGLNG